MRALVCSFARNESFVPQGTFPAASGIHLGAIRLIGRSYARLRAPSSEWPLSVPPKRVSEPRCPLRTKALRTKRPQAIWTNLWSPEG